jgi:small-conductance mechanosensitive channel
VRRATAFAATLLAAVSFAACGSSPEDDARNEGEQIGADIRDLYGVSSVDEAQTVLQNLQSDVQDISEETRDKVSEQVETQRATLASAIEALGEGDENALNAAVQQIRAQADAFRSGTDSVANEFWRGFEEGYDDS